jgi:ribosomal protein S18 acetylase RimI-like enzyme
MPQRNLLPENFALRRVLEREADDLRALYAASIAANPLGFIQDLGHHGDIYERGIAFQQNFGELIALFDMDELVGMGALKNKTFDRVELCHLHLHPVYQGQGLGKAIAEELLKLAEALGYQTVELHVTATQKAALRLYRKLGFIETRRQVYDVKGQSFDTVFMDRHFFDHPESDTMI